MKNRSYHLSGSRFLMTGTALVIMAGSLAAVAFNPFKALKRARMAESINKVRMINLGLQTFAVDHDGALPVDALAEQVGLSGKARWSNDLFRQLLAGGYIDLESVFWVKGAQVCNPKEPDDVIAKDGDFAAGEALQAGDCGWAYLPGLTHAGNPSWPVVLDAYKPGTSDFDLRIWDGKVIVARLDGSVITAKIDANGRPTVDGEDLLGARAALWKESGKDPVKLLLQPEPAQAPEKHEEIPAEGPAGGATKKD